MFIMSLNVFSQSDTFKVKDDSFHKIEGCITIPARYDDNDAAMAVVKIIPENINEQDRAKLYFEGNLATFIEVEQNIGETWVYLTAEAATFLRIKHPDFGVTEFWFPMSLKPKQCYEMVLQNVDITPVAEVGFLSISSEPNGADIYVDGKHCGMTNKVVTDLAEGSHTLRLEKQGYVTLTKTINITKGETLQLNETLQSISSQRTYLIVKTDQQEALIYIDDEPINTGEASKSVNIGTTHTYKIECNLYHEESGTVMVNDRMTIEKKLRPNFGYINVTTSPEQGAKVYVDAKYIGESPIKTDKLASGTHTVRVMKDMFKMKEQSFTVTDGQTTNANITMTANFVMLTVDTDADSDIYVDEEYKGKGKWTGRVSEGLHNVEARKAKHRSSTKTVDLVLGENKTMTLEAPKPISGSIDVNSSPMSAEIYIDGKHYGQTPNYINEIIIGTHELKLEKSGCATLTKTITIKENETLTINEKLQTGKEITISTDKSGDKIYVDGNYLGTSPITSNLSYGSHNIKAVRNDKEVSKTITVSQSGGENNVKLAFFGNQTITVNGVSFTMVAVEGGTFQMGATSYGNDSPVHSVTLSDYYIGETEVTQELWEAVMGSNPSNYEGSQKPVESVSWHDCKEFITKLNRLTGKNFRLPTEAEWEYAARGGNKSKGYKYSGSNTIDNVAWYDGNSGKAAHNVKTKSPNELGIYDMSGNVWEWCEDWYGDYSSGSQTNPAGPSSGSNRVFRGGNWDRYAEFCRVSLRLSIFPDYRDVLLGLRLCLSQY